MNRAWVRRAALVTILLVALLVRVVAVTSTPGFVPQTDSADFDRTAASLAAEGSFPSSELAPGGGPTALRPPLFALALAGVYKIIGPGSAPDRWEAGRIAEAGFGTVSVGLLMAIALALWGWAAALLAGLLAAIDLPLILVGSSLMSESLFIPLVLGATLVALHGRRRGGAWRWAVAAGLLVGLAALTRSVGIVLALPVAALLWCRRPRLARHALVAPVLVLAAAGLTLVPWTLRNLEVLHRFVPISTEGGGALAGTYNGIARHRRDFPGYWLPPVVQYEALARIDPHANEAEASSRFTHDGLRYIARHPAYVLQVLFVSAERMLDLPGPGLSRFTARYEAYDPGLATSSVYAFWIVGALALCGVLTARVRRGPAALWGVPLAVVLPTIVFTGGTRYRSPADPFVILLAVAALLSVGRMVADRRRREHPLPSPSR